jgi:bifunctional non-homologous end joining protein LigD
MGRNFGAIELHPWTSTLVDPHEPTWAFLDIDPGAKNQLVTRLHRTALEHLGVERCPKVTGKRGIQIWIPVARGYTFDDTRAWVVEPLWRLIGGTVADMVNWEWKVAKRSGLTRLDVARQEHGTTVRVGGFKGSAVSFAKSMGPPRRQ